LFLYNGDTRIVGGTLLVTHTNALMNTTLDMNIADSGALNCGTLTNVSIGSFKGSRSFGLTNGSGGALELNVGNKVGSSDSYQGTLSGSGSLVKIGTGVWQLGAGGAGNGIYTGDTRVTDGFLRAGANNAFPHGAGKGNMVIQAPGTLDFLDRTAISVNGLSGDGTVNDSDGGANPPGTICNFIIGDGGASAEFSGVIQNVAAPSKTSLVVTLIKTNSGTQILSGVNTYSGTTTVKGGTLLVNSPGSLPATTVTVNNGGTFGGTGTAGGSVSLANGGTLKPGASIGLLTIGGNLTMAAGSTNVFEVDLDTLSADQVSAGAVAYGGSLVVTNIGGTASATNGASMQIFTTAGSGTFAATNLPSLPTGLVWDLSTIGADGTIRIAASSVNTTPPTLTNHLSGNLLTLSWPLDHTGWILQAQTNSVNVGLTTNWFPVPGSSSTNQIIMTVNPANGTVFYRLFYP
jgi:autotransporter-associated beta strand protein